MQAKLEYLQPGTAGEGFHNLERPNQVLRSGGTNTWLLEYTVAGRGIGWLKGREYLMPPGSFVLFRSGVCQHYEVDTRVGSWQHIWCCFDPRPHWQDWLKLPELLPGILLLQIKRKAQREQILKALNQAVRYAWSVRPQRRSLVLNCLEEALLFCDEWNPSRSSASRDERIQVVLEYIHEHAFEPLNIALLAKLCSLSPSRFSHLFQEQMGQAPMQYIEERRLDRARELLMISSRPISQIAEECGFNSAYYFSRMFKARTGMSPREARNAYRSGAG